MEHNQAQNRVDVVIPKENAYEKKIVMSCNVAYPDEDTLVLHYDLIVWIKENVGRCGIEESYTDFIFNFDNQEDAALFKLTYA